MMSLIRSKLAYVLRKRLGFPLEELALSRLKDNGFNPQVVLDVGASYGLFADQVWQFWSECEVHCFEPDSEYVKKLWAHTKDNHRLYVNQSLVGAKAEAEVIYHHILGASTILKENTDIVEQQNKTCGPVRTCSMTSIDNYCDKHHLKPDFLKIDVQGYELEVLKGAENYLSSIEVILTEVNHIEVYQGVPLAAELIEWLSKHGYALHDIFNFMRRPLDDALWQTDMIFVRHDSPLRANKRFD